MTNYALLVCVLISFATISNADDGPATITAPKVTTRPRQVFIAPISAKNNATDDATASTTDAKKFITEAKWILAGYNNNEIVYQIFVTNQDTRIIRCITEVKGFYVENGKKLPISDRQITTVFPNQPTQVGNWMDLDKDSGADYSVKCHMV